MLVVLVFEVDLCFCLVLSSVRFFFYECCYCFVIKPGQLSRYTRN